MNVFFELLAKCKEAQINVMFTCADYYIVEDGDDTKHFTDIQLVFNLLDAKIAYLRVWNE